MKKLLSICLLIMLMLPFLAYGNAPSPTLESLYTFKPDVDYVLYDPNPMVFMWSPHNPWSILEELSDEPDVNKFHMDDALILYLTEPIETLQVTFVLLYPQTSTIYAIFIDTINNHYLCKGDIQEDGSVIFNTSEVPAEEVIMYVMSDIYEG